MTRKAAAGIYTGKSVAEAVHATREMLQQLEEAPLEAELLVRHVHWPRPRWNLRPLERSSDACRIP